MLLTLRRPVSLSAAVLALLALCAFGLVAAHSAHAVVANPDDWTALGDGTSWSDLNNWSAGVPTSTSDVEIPSGTATSPILPTTATVNSLKIDLGATLDIQGTDTLNITGLFDVEGQTLPTTGKLANVTAGTTTIGASGTLDLGANGSTLGDLDSDVTINVTGAHIGRVELDQDATLELTAGSSFNVISNEPFQNEGTITLDAGSSVTGNPMNATITNDGTLTMDSGVTLQMGPLTNNGTVIAAAGANVETITSTFINSGTVTVQGGSGGLTISNPDTSMVTGGVLEEGTYNLDGPLTVAGGITSLGGPTVTLGQGFGTSTTFNALQSVTGGLFTIGGASTVVADTSDLSLNHGSMTVDGGATFTDSGTDQLLSNIGDGTLTLGAATINADVNSGNLNVIASTAPAVVVGTFETGSNAAVIASGADLDVRATAGSSGSGTYTLSGGNLYGTGTITGTLDQTGGTLWPGTEALGNFMAVGTLHVDGAYDQTSGTLDLYVADSGPSSLAVTGTATLLGNGTTLSPFMGAGNTFSNDTPNPNNGGTHTLPYGAYPFMTGATIVTAGGGLTAPDYAPTGLTLPGSSGMGHYETGADFVVDQGADSAALSIVEPTAPGDPTALTPSRAVNSSSTDPITVTFTPGVDDTYGSGVKGTCVSFDLTQNTSGLGTCQSGQLVTGGTASSGNLAPGTYWFHAVTLDENGNRSADTETIGPFTVVAPTPAPTPTAPPVAPPPAGIATSALGTPTNVTTVAGQSATATTAGTGGSTATLSIPAGALPAGTTVSTYPVTTAQALAGAVPPNNSYILAFAVSWVAPDGTSPNATAPLHLTVSDPAVKAGDTVWEVTATGLKQVGTAIADGVASITFENDPVFVLSASPQLLLHGTPAVKKGQLVLHLSCRVGTRCLGTASATYTMTTRHGKHIVKHVTIVATGSVRNVHGETQLFSLRLTKAGKALLAHGKRVKLTVKLVTKGGVTSTHTITVR